MKNAGFVLVAGLMVLAGSCKKVCYQCNQYCVYCQKSKDSTIIYKVCDKTAINNHRIDSIRAAFPDTAFICNILNNSKQVCGNKNSANSGVNYYEQEDYFCTLQ
jgi:hypothetical protein